MIKSTSPAHDIMDQLENKTALTEVIDNLKKFSNQDFDITHTNSVQENFLDVALRVYRNIDCDFLKLASYLIEKGLPLDSSDNHYCSMNSLALNALNHAQPSENDDGTPSYSLDLVRMLLAANANVDIIRHTPQTLAT